MTSSPAHEPPDPAHEPPAPDRGAPAEPPGLHHVGRRVAEALGLGAHELAALDPDPQTPTWASSLLVAELAADSAALSSLAIALVGAARGGTGLDDGSVAPEAARVQASFGSERLFRIDGAAPPIWAPLSGFWRVGDGWVRTHGNYPHHAERLARLLGIAPQAERAEVEAGMLRWSRFELEERAVEAGALAIAVRDPSEWRRHPQYPVLAESPVVRFAQVGDAAPRAWRGAGGLPLAGVRVLDLTRVIAGPVATRDLAVAGAEVLRVDSPRLPEATWQHLDTGQQKRTTLLDLGDPADFARLQRLLETADVVVHGYRPSALAKHGLDFDSLRERFPGIVVAQLSAWGARGPWGDRRGFDSLVQAASGIAILESADGGATPGALPVQALDHSAGHFLAASVATALRTQRSGGRSFGIDISLARIANELLAAGSADRSVAPGVDSALPTSSVPLRPAPGEAAATITCAPPLLAFPGAPAEYPSPLHPWGSDRAVWVGEDPGAPPRTPEQNFPCSDSRTQEARTGTLTEPRRPATE